MHSLTRAKLKRPGGARRRLSLVSFLCGGILLQTTTSGCEGSLSSIAGALGQPLDTGIGNSLSKLAEAMVLNLFI